MGCVLLVPRPSTVRCTHQVTKRGSRGGSHPGYRQQAPPEETEAQDSARSQVQPRLAGFRPTPASTAGKLPAGVGSTRVGSSFSSSVSQGGGYNVCPPIRPLATAPHTPAGHCPPLVHTPFPAPDSRRDTWGDPAQRALKPLAKHPTSPQGSKQGHGVTGTWLRGRTPASTRWQSLSGYLLHELPAGEDAS